MHVLIIGVAGTGKSYLVNKLREKGINVVDADSNIGLAKFVNSKGNEVRYNPNGGNKWWSTHFHVLNIRILKKLLKENKILYLFGHVGGQSGKGNGIFDVINLFDKVFYLSAPKRLIANRIKIRTDNPFGKHPEELKGVLYSKDKEDKMARILGLQFIDATLPTEKIIRIIMS